MIKLTQDSFKRQNMVAAFVGDHDTYKKRSIMFYWFLFGGTAVSYGIVFPALTFVYEPAVAFIIAHSIAMGVVNAALITWVALDLLRPIPIPQGKGSNPKAMSILCLFCVVLVFILILYTRSLDAFALKVFVAGAGGFILYGLVALFAERIDNVREDAYCDNYVVDNDYDLNDDLVCNPSFKDYSCNIYHEDDK